MHLTSVTLLPDPCIFVEISFTPANSTTALTVLDAIKPDPFGAGFKKTEVHDFNGIVVWEYENSN